MVNVQNPHQFLEDFAEQAGKAKKRIYLQSMLFEHGTLLGQLEPILIRKAKEGIDVRIHTDWVSQRYTEGNPNIIPPFYGARRKYMLALHHQSKLLKDRLTDAGVKITMTNQPGFLSRMLCIFKRNHKKLYIVDGISWLGGVNLFDFALTMIDFMVKFTDPSFASLMAQEFSKVNNKKPKHNYSIDFNDDYDVLVDAGIVGRSLIQNEAIKLIGQSTESVIFASQFVPEGKLLKALLEASDRGANITIITCPRSHEYFTKLPYKILYKIFRFKIKNKKNILLLHQDRMVHAKLIIVDKKSAIFGSHNLVSAGGTLGTEEIAVKTRDKELIKQLEDFLNSETKR